MTLTRLIRILRALWEAGRLTLRGQPYTPPLPAYPELRQWAAATESLVTALLRQAEVSGLDLAARQALTLSIDKRTISMQTILAAVQHHAAREYPQLLDSRLEHVVLTIKALNMNDVYRLQRLAEVVTDAPIQTAVQRLLSHLSQMPPALSTHH